MEKRLSDFIKENYDNYFGTVSSGSGSLRQKFKASTILEDLIKNGVDVYDALDILHEIRPFLQKDIHTSRITKLVNKLIYDKGYDESYTINGNLLEDSFMSSKAGHFCLQVLI